MTRRTIATRRDRAAATTIGATTRQLSPAGIGSSSETVAGDRFDSHNLGATVPSRRLSAKRPRLSHVPAAPFLSRRRLLQAGASGAATVWVAGRWPAFEGVASAAPLTPELKRSTWLGVTDRTFRATRDGRTAAVTLAEVADLPIAAQIPALRGHDGAFAVRFTGADGIEQGRWTLHNDELGDVQLFVSPVEADTGGARSYEAIVDRTIRIAGVNEEGAPAAVPSGDRGGQPPSIAAPGVAAVYATPAAKKVAVARPKPRLRRAVLTRTASARRATLELSLAEAGTVASVRALLMSNGEVVARGHVSARQSTRIKLRFSARSPLRRSHYRVVLTLIGHDGRVTTIRKILEVA